MTIVLPPRSLVVLVGMSGSGKSTFAARHFKRTEVLSSDFCRALVSDDEASMAASRDAFDVLHLIADRRLATGHLTVVDATNVRADARRRLLALARKNAVPATAVVFDLPLEVCAVRDRLRPGRSVGEDVLRRQHELLQRSLRRLDREGFDRIVIFRTCDEVDAAEVELSESSVSPP
jgi:protein phosphatase